MQNSLSPLIRHWRYHCLALCCIDLYKLTLGSWFSTSSGSMYRDWGFQIVSDVGLRCRKFHQPLVHSLHPPSRRGHSRLFDLHLWIQGRWGVMCISVNDFYSNPLPEPMSTHHHWRPASSISQERFKISTIKMDLKFNMFKIVATSPKWVNSLWPSDAI